MTYAVSQVNTYLIRFKTIIFICAEYKTMENKSTACSTKQDKSAMQTSFKFSHSTDAMKTSSKSQSVLIHKVKFIGL